MSANLPQSSQQTSVWSVLLVSCYYLKSEAQKDEVTKFTLLVTVRAKI